MIPLKCQSCGKLSTLPDIKVNNEDPLCRCGGDLIGMSVPFKFNPDPMTEKQCATLAKSLRNFSPYIDLPQYIDREEKLRYLNARAYSRLTKGMAIVLVDRLMDYSYDWSRGQWNQTKTDEMLKLLAHYGLIK